MSNKRIAVWIPVLVAIIGFSGTVLTQVLERYQSVDKNIATPVEAQEPPSISIENNIGDVSAESNNKGVNVTSSVQSEDSLAGSTSNSRPTTPPSTTTPIAEFSSQPSVPVQPEAIERQDISVFSPPIADSDGTTITVEGNIESNLGTTNQYAPTQTGDIRCSDTSYACGPGAESIVHITTNNIYDSTESGVNSQQLATDEAPGRRQKSDYYNPTPRQPSSNATQTQLEHWLNDGY